MRTEHVPTIILGAGPAGLSLGYEMLRMGMSCLILEKGDRAGESFAHYPKQIWFGPWLNNTLPGSGVPWHWLLRRTTQPAYSWYLGEYARRNVLPIRFQAEVQRVCRSGNRFVVKTRDGSVLSCDALVNATGYFSKPYLPTVPGLEGSNLPYLHSAHYREAEDARRLLGRDIGKVLVVGQGLSAGETMCELAREGFDVALSHRGALKIGPSVLLESLLSPLMWIREQLAVKLGWRLNSNPPMAGGQSRRLIEQGEVRTFPTMAEVEDKTVVFADGRREAFDLIVFCTGYRYAQDHLVELLGAQPPELKAGVESRLVPGLFFLGLDQQRSFRSRFLRGIRSDAEYLAQHLRRHLVGVDSGLDVSRPEPILAEEMFDPEESVYLTNT